jgi:hypothetical protein
MAFLIDVLITTTITDLGNVTLADSLTNNAASPPLYFDLERQFTIEEIGSSQDLQDAINSSPQKIRVINPQTGQPIVGDVNINVAATNITLTDLAQQELGQHKDTDFETIPLEGPPAETSPETSGSQVGDITVYNGAAWEPIRFSYRHIQESASTTWVINHGLRRFPSVTVVNSNGVVVEADVQYTDQTQVTVTFNSAEFGKAYLT